MTLHEVQLEFERIYAERYAYDDDTSGARLHALRAVAPMLIAQGMREAIEIWERNALEFNDLGTEAVRARAQELEQQ